MKNLPIKRVLLIFPPTITSMETAHFACPPLGLAYIAAAVRDRYEVKILDATVLGYKNEVITKKGMVRFGLSACDIEKKIVDFSPQVIGISCLYSSQFPEVISICRLAKAVNPQIVTVTGGAHPTFLPVLSLEHNELDFIVLGEGEVTFNKLLTAISLNEGVGRIDGLAYKQNGLICINKKKDFIYNLDTIPYPARDLLPMEKYFSIDTPMGVTSKKRPATSLITSRGCTMKCSFCSSHIFWGNRFRTRSPEDVIAEIEHLVSCYGVKEIRFHDDSLTLDRQRAKEIFLMVIEKKLNISWTVPNGLPVWTLDEELLSLMKESGCYEISLAVESGDEQVLKNIIHKPVNLDRIKMIVKKIKDKKIDVSAFFMVGFPGETRVQIKKTFSYAHTLLPDRASLMIFNPLPGTPLTERLKAEGHIDDSFRFQDNDYCRASLFFSEVTKEELEGMRNRFFLFYNLKLFFKRPVKFILRYGRIGIFHPSLAADILHLKPIRLSLVRIKRHIFTIKTRFY